MNRSRLVVIAVVAVLAAAGGGLLALDAGLLDTGEYERATVSVTDADGTQLTTVDVRVADSYQKRYTGLSNTSSLGDDEGMLFVHDQPGTYGYVMRDMAFPLDILFVAPNGTVTEIHHARLPPTGTSDGELTRYRGTGKYVLEVPYGYTNETGVSVGDTVEIDGYDG